MAKQPKRRLRTKGQLPVRVFEPEKLAPEEPPKNKREHRSRTEAGVSDVNDMLGIMYERSKDCPECAGMGHSPQEIRSARGTLEGRTFPMPCRQSDCAMGTIARAMQDAKRSVRTDDPPQVMGTDGVPRPRRSAMDDAIRRVRSGR